MKKYRNQLKITIIFGIVACIMTYAVAFCAFDKETVIEAYGDYEFYIPYLILAMFVTGIISTVWIVQYIAIERLSIKRLLVVNISMGILNVFFGILGLRSGRSLINATVFGYTDTYVEETSNFFAKCYMVASYVFLFISVVHVFNVIICWIRAKRFSEQGCVKDINGKFFSEKPTFMPAYVSGALVTTVAIGTLCSYGIPIVCWCIIPYMMAFPVPIVLWLCIVVSRWEREKKLHLAIISYIVYIILTYGVMHCFFAEPISWMLTMISFIMDVGLISIINIAVSVVAIGDLIKKRIAANDIVER